MHKIHMEYYLHSSKTQTLLFYIFITRWDFSEECALDFCPKVWIF